MNNRKDFISKFGKVLEGLGLGIKLRPVFMDRELIVVRVISGNKIHTVEVGTRSNINIMRDIVDVL